MNDQADATICSSISASDSDFNVTKDSRPAGIPVDPATLGNNANQAILTRDETPSLMKKDIVLNGDQHCELITQMAQNLRISALNKDTLVERVIENMKVDISHHHYINVTLSLHQEQNSDLQAESIEANYDCNTYRIHDNPSNCRPSHAIKRQSAPPCQPSTSTSPVSNHIINEATNNSTAPHELLPAFNEEDIDTDKSINQSIIPSELDNCDVSGMIGGDARIQCVHSLTKSSRGLENMSNYAIIDSERNNHEYQIESVVVDRVVEPTMVTSPQINPMMRPNYVRNHTCPLEDELKMSIGILCLPNVSLEPIHNFVAPRLKLDSPIYMFLRGEEPAYHDSDSYTKVKKIRKYYETIPAVRYSVHKFKRIPKFRLLQYLIATTSTNYILTTLDALNILPHKSSDESGKYGTWTPSPHTRLKRYVLKQCESFRHTFLLSYLRLQTLPRSVNFTRPDYFKEEIDALRAETDPQGSEDDYQSHVT